MNNIFVYLSLTTGGLVILLIFIDIVSDFVYIWETDSMRMQHNRQRIMHKIRMRGQRHGNKICSKR